MARSTNMIVPEVMQYEGVRRFMERIDLFNEASAGTILLEYDRDFLAQWGGDFRQPLRFARTTAGDSHIDEANPTSGVSPTAISQARGYFPNQQRKSFWTYTEDEVQSSGQTIEQWSGAVGVHMADAKLYKIRENLLAAGVAALDSVDTPTANCHISDVARGKASGARVTCTLARLNSLLVKIGDARPEITTFVMHSAVFADLVGDSITNYKIENVGGATLVRDVVQALGRNILVMDSASLYSALTSSYYTEYYVLGLGPGALKAVIVKENAPNTKTVIAEEVTSYDVRQDYTVRFEVNGMQWVTTINPTDAELATAAKWNEYYSDHREMNLLKLVCNVSA